MKANYAIPTTEVTMNDSSKIGCDKVGELIVEYIDGELDESTAELIKKHILGCPDCQKLYRDMALVCSSAAESAYDAPEELHDRVMSSIRRDITSRNRRAGIRNMMKTSRWLGVGIAAMLFICVGVAGSFKLLPKLLNTEVANEVAPTSPYYDAVADENLSFAPAEAEDAALDHGGIYTTSADKHETASSEVFVYKRIKAVSTAIAEETSVAANEKDDSMPAPAAPSENGASAEAERPSSEGAIALPSLPPAQMIVGTWKIDTEGSAVTLVITDKDQSKFTITTSTEIITGSYTLNDHFLSFEISGKSPALYIVGIDNGEMTLLQISPEGLF